VLPTFRSDLFLTLLAPAFTVTMLGAIESLLSAVVSDRMSNDRHNPNVELMAQGVANIVSPLVCGLRQLEPSRGLQPISDLVRRLLWQE
jgi:SulP family sulfate permease